MNRSSKVFTMGLVGAVVIAITSWQPIFEHQSCTKESSLHEMHSKAVFVSDQRTITALPQNQVLINELPEFKFNKNFNVEHKIVNPAKLEKAEKEKITVTTGSKQESAKPPEQSNLKSVTHGMGDTCVVNGQKQVYFLGFGWIEDDNRPNQEIIANDMFENGDKVGNMEGSTVIDSDGDIDKMVGTMGD